MAVERAEATLIRQAQTAELVMLVSGGEILMHTFEQLVPSAPRGRFEGIRRSYRPADVIRLRGSIQFTHTLAERGANRLWQLLHDGGYVQALGAVTGNQAV